MKRGSILAAFAALAALTGGLHTRLAADDKKELKLPPLDAKEWKEVKDKGGLKVWDVKEGKGDEVKAGAKVKVHYTGWLTNGKVFDSSVQRGEPFETGLDMVIKGWQEGIPGMKVGGVRRLYIPAAMAYGKKGAGRGLIPPDSDLVFEVELLDVPK
jgi:FKBP-type peptidyl-prolyl cis-trans isomerase